MINLPMPKSCEQCRQLGYNKTAKCYINDYSINYTSFSNVEQITTIPQNCPIKVTDLR